MCVREEDVTTPSAKADGFLGNGPLAVCSHRPSPGLQRARENVLGGVDISLQYKTTERATVDTLRQALPNLRVATAALLACAAAINLYPQPTSSFSLVSEGFQKASPAGIGNRAGKPVVPEHPTNVQAFHRDYPVATNQFESSFVPVIVSATCYSGVQSLKTNDSLFPVSSALLFAAYRSAQPTKFWRLLFEKPWIWFMFTVRCGEKILNADIYPDRRQVVRLNCSISEVTGKHDEPLVRFPFEGRRLYRTFNRAVNLAADCADILHAKPLVQQSDAVAVRGELDRVESILRLEPGMSRFLPGLNATEKVGERLIEASHCALGAAEVRLGKPLVNAALRLEPRGLLAISNGLLVLFPRLFALGETGVVQPAVGFEHDAQFPRLVAIWEKPEFVRLPHLPALLVGNVLLYAAAGNAPNRTDEIASAPQRWQSALEKGELVAKRMRRGAFEPVCEFCRAPARVGLDKQVNVVWHHFKRVSRNLKLRCLLGQQNLKPIGYITNKNRAAVLRTPHDVVLQREDRTGVFGISRVHSGIIHSPQGDCNNHIEKYLQKELAFSSAS
jgi:hypothetical protein